MLLQKEGKQSSQRCRPSGLTPRKTNEVSDHTRELCSIGCFFKGRRKGTRNQNMAPGYYTLLTFRPPVRTEVPIQPWHSCLLAKTEPSDFGCPHSTWLCGLDQQLRTINAAEERSRPYQVWEIRDGLLVWRKCKITIERLNDVLFFLTLCTGSFEQWRNAPLRVPELCSVEDSLT